MNEASRIVTLTAAEIIDLAAFLGMNVTADPGGVEPETEVHVYLCPPDGVRCEGEPSDPEAVAHYRYVAVCGEYPEEGCMGLGPEIAKASA